MDKSIRDDIRQVGVVTKYEVLKHTRSKRMLVFSGIAALLFILITALQFFLNGEFPKDPKEFISSYVGMVNLLVIIGVSLFCASAIASEFEERTALLMFPRPIKKTSFFAGKVLACFTVCGGIIAIYYAACMVFCLAYTGGLDVTSFYSLGFALLFMLGAGGFALFISSISGKGSMAVVITIATLLLVFNIVDSMFSLFRIEPVFSITYAAVDILNVIQGHVTSFTDLSSYGIDMTIGNYYPSHWLSITIMTTWFTVTTVLAALIFGRREF
jgi:ABC-2 type transport system permease protein